MTGLAPTGVNLADVPTPRKRAGNDNESPPRRTPRPETPSSDDYDPSDYA